MKEKPNELDLQGYLDGEITADRRSEVESWVAGDANAAALLQELRSTRSVLRDNEPERRLPAAVSREFYWSRIERAILQADSTTSIARQPVVSTPWLRWFAPIAGLACLVALAIWSGFFSAVSRDQVQEAITETTVTDMTAFNFRSESAGMSVVWVQNADAR